MFIAMNRFRVKKGSEQAFEKVWLSRDSQLNKVPGFVEFHLLKGPEHEDFTLYASHTVWQTRVLSKRGPSRRHFVPPTRMPARISPSTSTIRNSKVSRYVRPYIEAKPRSPRGLLA
jgi:hypothetical protein